MRGRSKFLRALRSPVFVVWYSAPGFPHLLTLRAKKEKVLVRALLVLTVPNATSVLVVRNGTFVVVRTCGL